MRSRSGAGRPAVIVGACRTPFQRSGTGFADLSAYDLGRIAVAGLLHRTPIDPSAVDVLLMGTVVADPSTSNVAREIGLACGLPCPAYTVTVACVSANTAIQDAINYIAAGTAEVAIAGGTETLSDAPIRVSRPVRKRLIASQKARGLKDWLGLLRGLHLRDLAPEIPAIADFSTGLTMGQNAERLARRLGISRADQDSYALRSHHLADRATRDGRLDAQIVPVLPPPACEVIRSDNGIRGDSTPEKMAALRPAFDRQFGTITAANSSFLTDGASAVLLASEEAARKLGLSALASIRSTSMTAGDALEELLLGPAFAIPEALDAAGLTARDIGVFEIHEAFAVQMLANLRLLDDQRFARERLKREAAVGPIDLERVNTWGGSLSIGHPFGATGGRLIATCCERMRTESARFGLVAACAAGAIGSAMVLEAVER